MNEQAEVTERILRHLGLPTDFPPPAPARAPPDPFEDGAFGLSATEVNEDSAYDSVC